VASLPARLLIARLELGRRRRSVWLDEAMAGPLHGDPGVPEPPEEVRRCHAVERMEAGGATAWEIGPRRGGARRRMLHLHGGGFVDEINAQGWDLVSRLGRRLDARVLVPLYPLTPAHTYRDAVPVVLAAYQRALGDAGPAGVVVSGDSAGAWLALALHHAARADGLPREAALVLISPWLDPALAGPEIAEVEARDPLGLAPFLRRTGRAWAGEDGVDDPRMQPMHGDLGDLPLTITVAGTRDIALADSRALARAAATVRLLEYDGVPHGFALRPGLPEAQRAMRRIAETVERAGA
jgi:monoterpene epsilon-lactone hydrolase